MTVRDVFNALAMHAPVELKMDFDNVGHLAGRAGRRRHPGCCGAGHHRRCDCGGGGTGRGAHRLAPSAHLRQHQERNGRRPHGAKACGSAGRGMSAICMHTNLDAAQGGVNDALAAALGAQVQGVLNSEEWISRIAELPEAVEFGEFLSRVKLALGANGLRYAGPGRPVKRIGLCGGAGGGGYVPGARARLRHPMSPRTSSTTSSSPPTSWASTWWTAGISHGERGRARARRLAARGLA